MVTGQWYSDDDARTLRSDGDGRFVRQASRVRGWLHRGEPARYRLIIMRGCPWAHRTHIVWQLEGLAPFVSLITTADRPTDQGWVFDAENPDPEGRSALYEYYREGVERYTGRVTVPMLWDTCERRMISNESADIIRMLDVAFDHLRSKRLDLYPEQHRDEIDELNGWVYQLLNNGVYRAGFAAGERAHRDARTDVFLALGRLEQRLSDGRDYLVGDALTLADVRLLPTLARFPAYFYAFRCNERPLTSYRWLWRYARRIAAIPAIASTLLDPMHYIMGYRSIPFAIGHDDPLPDEPPAPLLC